MTIVMLLILKDKHGLRCYDNNSSVARGKADFFNGGEK